jgi:hypothetical protein
VTSGSCPGSRLIGYGGQRVWALTTKCPTREEERSVDHHDSDHHCLGPARDLSRAAGGLGGQREPPRSMRVDLLMLPKWDELARLLVMAVCGWGLMIGAIWVIAQIV